MLPSKKEYAKTVSEASKPSKKAKDFVLAFTVGGFICVLGELLGKLYLYIGLSDFTAKALVPVTLIFISALLTGLGVFPKIAKHAGAGTLIPITGFANAVVSPAIEYKKEGQITGIGANIFKIAGPVLVFGISASIIYGIIYYCFVL